MRRYWHYSFHNSGNILSWSFMILPPRNDDYYQNQWDISLSLFGFYFNFGTWKE